MMSPGSNWLDRLRTSRGFPTGNQPDLDRFLTSSPGSTTRPHPTHSSRRVNSLMRCVSKEKDVMRDLFSIGECSTSFSSKKKLKKKNCRKQSNPRFFNLGGLGNTGDEVCQLDSLMMETDNVETGLCELEVGWMNFKWVFMERVLCGISDEIRNGSGGDNGEEEEEEQETVDLKEYTKNEVTVIDTSLEEWKSDKWVFRKKDVWKIKDKKKSKFAGKKRKLRDDYDDMTERNKEGCDIDEGMTKNENILQPNKPQNEKARELLEEAAKFVGKAPQNSFPCPPEKCPCPRPPENLRIESSSVILLKSISSNNNANGIIRLGKSAKKGCPRKFKII